MDAFMFLLKLAYESRFRLPVLLTVCFMVFDIRLRLEINVHTRQVRRQMRPANLQNQPIEPQEGRESEASNDSWMTLEDIEEQIGDGIDTDDEPSASHPESNQACILPSTSHSEVTM